MTSAPPSAFEILLVEDSPTDALMTREALGRSGVPHHLSVVRDGCEAMMFLERSGLFAAAPRPTLVLLDLNMPRMDGRELLAWLRGQAAFRCLPAVVLTTSSHDEDVSRSYVLGANAYVVKDIDFRSFAAKLEVLMRFWGQVAMLPGVIGLPLSPRPSLPERPAA